jgi:hypothetical protein
VQKISFLEFLKFDFKENNLKSTKNKNRNYNQNGATRSRNYKLFGVLRSRTSLGRVKSELQAVRKKSQSDFTQTVKIKTDK